VDCAGLAGMGWDGLGWDGMAGVRCAGERRRLPPPRARSRARLYWRARGPASVARRLLSTGPSCAAPRPQLIPRPPGCCDRPGEQQPYSDEDEDEEGQQEQQQEQRQQGAGSGEGEGQQEPKAKRLRSEG
jgi:hypothetical protein